MSCNDLGKTKYKTGRDSLSLSSGESGLEENLQRHFDH